MYRRLHYVFKKCVYINKLFEHKTKYIFLFFITCFTLLFTNQFLLLC